MSKIYIADTILMNCFTMANYFSAMDVPSALSIPSEPPYQTDNALAPKELSTSRLIISLIVAT